MTQEIIAYFIIAVAIAVAAIHFYRKYKRIKNNQDACGGCSNSSCDGCAIKKINNAKKLNKS
jgi:hypothetical protein